MQRSLLSLFLCLLAFNSFGQRNVDKQEYAIQQEGVRLYQSEMASWYGTDLFLVDFKPRERIGGYFSYSENKIAKCIFFSKEEKPRVIGSISFDSTYNVNTANVDLAERAFSATEASLFAIRFNALRIINSDTLFKQYKDTKLNLIPIISNGEKKVYILTGPQKTGVVIFGNDYLLTFRNDNTLRSKKALHKNIIPITYSEDSNKPDIGAMHSHSPDTGEFITPTDICTLMLYEKKARWKQHTVVSANYVSLWNCEKNQLVILTRKAIQRINEDQKKRHPDKYPAIK